MESLTLTESNHVSKNADVLLRHLQTFISGRNINDKLEFNVKTPSDETIVVFEGSQSWMRADEYRRLVHLLHGNDISTVKKLEISYMIGLTIANEGKIDYYIVNIKLIR